MMGGPVGPLIDPGRVEDRENAGCQDTHRVDPDARLHERNRLGENGAFGIERVLSWQQLDPIGSRGS
jgi:hypothetical protein